MDSFHPSHCNKCVIISITIIIVVVMMMMIIIIIFYVRDSIVSTLTQIRCRFVDTYVGTRKMSVQPACHPAKLDALLLPS